MKRPKATTTNHMGAMVPRDREGPRDTDDPELSIPDRLWRDIVSYYEHRYRGIHPRAFPIDIFARQRVDSAYRQLVRLHSLAPPGAAPCLDAGCGIGAFAAVANMAGFNFFGYDIDADAISLAKELFEANGLPPSRIILRNAERPFQDLDFQLITSFQVLEHVRDVDHYFQELRDLVDSNGMVFIEAPNYAIPYESHFYVLFPPGPRPFKWAAVRLAGRDNRRFFDDLNFVTPRRVASALECAGFKLTDLGAQEWVTQVKNGPTADRSRHVKVVFGFAKRVRLQWLLVWLGRHGFYTPIVFLARPGNPK